MYGPNPPRVAHEAAALRQRSLRRDPGGRCKHRSLPSQSSQTEHGEAASGADDTIKWQVERLSHRERGQLIRAKVKIGRTRSGVQNSIDATSKVSRAEN